MRGRVIAGFCERCGRRFDLHRPRPGARDVGLNRIRASFRYCTGCHQFVGRECCWNPEAVACQVCVPIVDDRPLDAAPQVLSLAGPDGLRHPLDELRAAVTGLEIVGDSLQRLMERPREPRDAAIAAWDEAWAAVGWLLARADSCRDAAARRLWEAPLIAGTAEPEAKGELKDLVSGYERTQRSLSRRFREAGRWVAERPERPPVVVVSSVVTGAWRRRIAASAAVVALVALSAGVGLGALDRLSSFVGGPASSPGESPGEAVLGGTPPTPRPTPSTAAVEATVGFDLFRIGALTPSPGAVASVAGAPQVIAFPSPFNRSVRLAGDGDQALCMAVPRLHEGRTRLAFELYREEPTGGALAISLIPKAATSRSITLPASFVSALPVERWMRVTTSWTESDVVSVKVRAADGELVAADALPTGPAAAAPPGSACLAMTASSDTGSLLVDAVSVVQ